MKSHSDFSRRSIIKLLGTTAAGAPFVTSNLMAQSPSTTVRHACFGLGGMAESDLAHISNCKNVEIVAFCDVDLAKAAPARAKFPKARFYQDWREMLDKEAGNIDSVNVSTPDHMHAPMGINAMQLGKHVYGQKPLAHSLHEVRRMTEVAKEKKVVTQMGIQIHSTAYYRMAAQVIQDGAIGKIKDYKLPRVTGADHWEQFIEACRGNGKTSADFSYAGPLTEAILLGGIASRFQNTTLKWNSKELKFDLPQANAFVRRDYREGWEISGQG